MKGNVNIVLAVLAVFFSILVVNAAIAGDRSYSAQTNLMIASELYPVPDEQVYSPERQDLGGRPFTLRGKVVSVDNEKNAMTVETASGPSAEGTVTLSTDKNTRVVTCDNMKSLEGVKIGDTVDVRYRGREGNIVAEDINVAQC